MDDDLDIESKARGGVAINRVTIINDRAAQWLALVGLAILAGYAAYEANQAELTLNPSPCV